VLLLPNKLGLGLPPLRMLAQVAKGFSPFGLGFVRIQA
jgi:hypothetical protein